MHRPEDGMPVAAGKRKQLGNEKCENPCAKDKIERQIER